MTVFLALALLAQHPFPVDPSVCRSCDLLAAAASALGEGNGAAFMSFFDKSAPAYADIEQDVNALTASNDIDASLDVLEENGDESQIEATVDWFIQATSKDGTEHVSRRRMRVKVVERKVKGKWKIVSIDPLFILAPITG